MKKMISLFLAMMMTLCICACQPTEGGSSEKSDDSSASTTPAAGSSSNSIAYEGGAVTVKFSHSLASRYDDLLDSAIVRFNAVYPNIQVQTEYIGATGDIAKMVEFMKSSGNLPNVVTCEPDTLESYVGWSLAEPLPDGYDLEEGFLPDCIVEGTLYALPLQRNTMVLYYNRDFFTENGLSAPTTWEEMKKLCEQIRTIDEKSVPLMVDYGAGLYQQLCARQGADISVADGLFGSEKANNVMTDLQEMAQKQLLCVKTNSDSCNVKDSFAGREGQNRCYMLISASYGANSFYSDFQVGVAAVPAGTPIAVGTDVCVLKNDDPQKTAAAKLFAAFLATDPAFQAELAIKGQRMPVIRSAYQTETYQAYLQTANGAENLQAQVASLCQSIEKYMVLPSFASRKVIESKIDTLMYECLHNNASVEQMLKEALNA